MWDPILFPVYFKYEDLKDGDRVLVETRIPAGYYEFLPGTVEVNNDAAFFPKRVRLDYDKSVSEPIMEHRMHRIKPINPK